MKYSWLSVIGLVWFAYLPAMMIADGLPQQSTPQFRSSTHLVLLDVTVTDKADHPFPGLTEKDFTILEDSVPQRIETFESPDVHIDPAQTSSAKEQARKSSEAAPVTILVLDELNTAFKDNTYARFKLGKFLESQSGGMPQATALLALTPTRLEVLCNYSRDPNALLRALSALPASIPWMLMEGGIHGETERLQATLNAVDQIASANSDRQRRKNIVWIGSGFRLFSRPMLFQQSTRDNAMAAIKEASRRLLRAHATIYTIDPSGLRVDSDGHAEVMAADGSIISAPTDPATGDLVFEALAPATGGKIFRLRNDVNTEIASAVSDGSIYYTLSYSPSNRNWDGKFRKISVQVSRPGLKVRTREGYYATEDPLESPSPDQALAEAVKSPVPYSGISVTPEIVKLTGNPASAQVTLGIDRHGLTWDLVPDGRRHAEITAIRAEISENGNVLDYRAVQKEVFIDKGTEEQFNRSLSLPVLFTMSANVPAKASRIRFVICDTASGRIGTADVSLKASSQEQANDPGHLP